jgi:hypothetical protein
MSTKAPLKCFDMHTVTAKVAATARRHRYHHQFLV